jgi:hypothetical protein
LAPTLPVAQITARTANTAVTVRRSGVLQMEYGITFSPFTMELLSAIGNILHLLTIINNRFPRKMHTYQ